MFGKLFALRGLPAPAGASNATGNAQGAATMNAAGPRDSDQGRYAGAPNPGSPDIILDKYGRPTAPQIIDGATYGPNQPWHPGQVLTPNQQNGYFANPGLIKHYKGDPGVQRLSGLMGRSSTWNIPPNPAAAVNGGNGSIYWAGSKPYKGDAGVQRVGAAASPYGGINSQYATAQATAANPAQGTSATYAALLSAWAR